MKKLFLYLLLFTGLFVLCYLLANAYYNQKLQEEEGRKLLADSISIDMEEGEKYFVGIRNGHVVVFEADSDHLYEYTGIDAQLLKELHPDIYEELQQMVEFNSGYEMYRYLESLAS